MIPEVIRPILEAAVRAPSGENAQPWRFTVSESNGNFYIDVRMHAESDQSLYSWGNRASYVAIGALLENMRLAASDFVFEEALLPETTDPLHVARIALTRGSSATADPLRKHIFDRATNRKKYDAYELTSEELRSLDFSGASYGRVFRLTTDKNAIRTLATIGALNERIMLNNEDLHRFFFEHVNWTKEADAARKTGFFIDTLELPPPAKIGFKVMSHWSRARLLNRYLRFNIMASRENALVYASASAIGVISAPEESVREAILSGKALQRLWLEATRMKLSVQPLAGALYLAHRIRAGAHKGFTDEEIAMLTHAYADIQDIFGLHGAVPYFMFRLGKSSPPSALSIRLPIEEVTTMQL